MRIHRSEDSELDNLTFPRCLRNIPEDEPESSLGMCHDQPNDMADYISYVYPGSGFRGNVSYRISHERG